MVRITEEDIAALKQRFIGVFDENVHRDGCDRLMDWLLSSDFFEAPASTKYHAAYKGGLLEHSLNVYDCLSKNIKSYGMEHTVTKETVAIVSLLHDICKANYYKVSHRNVKDDRGIWRKEPYYTVDEKFPCGDHADKSVILIQNFMPLKPDEILAIRAHMGGCDMAAKGGSGFISRIFEKSRLAVLLHISDMEATYLLEG